MNHPYGIFLFAVAFFGFLTVVSAVRAHRKKERVYYLSTMLGVLMVLIAVFIILNQVIFVLILMVAAAILGVAAYPKAMKAARREMVKQLQEVDLSAPLRVRDFFTNVGWFKLESKWGLWKTMCLFYLLSVVIIGGILFTLSTFSSFITMGYAVSCTATAPIPTTYMFYRQFKKALEKE